MTEKVVVKDLYKIFGPGAQRGVDLIKDGLNKEEIFEKTGLTVGVREASFTVNAGEIFVVMGLSGSGKSTLVRMLNRLIEPTAGEVLIDGKNVTKMEKKQLIKLRRDKMSMVFQSFALMPHMTVHENTAFGLEVAGIGKADRESRALSALEQVGLKPYAQSYPQELSGGMQQRVGLARALAQDPDIMLMDEAFSALDPLIRSEMQDELLKLQEDSERTVIFISHDLHEAMKIGDRIAMMEGGRIVQVGTPDEILKNPADKYVQSFFRGVDPTAVFASTDSLQEAIEREEPNLDGAFLKDVEPVEAETPLQNLLTVIRKSPCPVPVVDDQNTYLGVVSKSTFLRTLEHGVRASKEETAA